MRKVSAAELLELVTEGGRVLAQPAAPAGAPAPAPAVEVDLAGLIEAIRAIPQADLSGVIEAVRDVSIDVQVQPAPMTSWRFDVERDNRGRIAIVKANPIDE